MSNSHQTSDNGSAASSSSLNVDSELVIPPFPNSDDEDDIYNLGNLGNNDDDDDDDAENFYQDEDDEMNDIDRAAFAYLTRYEQMVRQQEAENHSTTYHIRPLFHRLRILGGSDEDDAEMIEGEEKQKNVEKQGVGRPTSYNVLPHSSSSMVPTPSDVATGEPGTIGEDEKKEVDLEKLGHCEPSNLLSYKAMAKALDVLENTVAGEGEVLRTDEQLMLVLKVLVSEWKEGKERKKKTDEAIDIEEKSAEALTKQSLSFPEFLHCYKTVIDGMFTLQMFPSPSTHTNDTSTVMFYRTRTKDRSMALLRTFGAHFESTNLETLVAPEAKTIKNDKQIQQIQKKKDTKENLSQELEKQNKIMEEMRQIIELKNQQITNLTKELQRSSIKKKLDLERGEPLDTPRRLSLKDGQVDNAKTYASTKHKSNNFVFRGINTFRGMSDVQKRRAIFCMVFGTSFIIWLCGAFFVVYIIKPPSPPSSMPIILQKEIVNPPEIANQNKMRGNISAATVTMESFNDLKKNYDESKEAITRLEIVKSAQLEQISRLHSTLAKTQITCESTSNKLEDDIAECKLDLISTKDKLYEEEAKVFNSTQHLKICQKQVTLLEPNTDLAEEQRRLVFESHYTKHRNLQRRRKYISILTGALGAILAPHVLPFLVKLGSITKIISLADSKGTAKFVIQFPWMSKFLNNFQASIKSIMDAWKLRF